MVDIKGSLKQKNYGKFRKFKKEKGVEIYN